jgi:tRNA G18 (ribose-2'-O)-methylase SpoU
MVNYRTMIQTEVVQDKNVLDEFKHMDTEDIFKIRQAEVLPVSALFLNILGDLNVGSMIRTATLFGFDHVTIFGRRRFDRRSTVGSLNYINVNVVDALAYADENPIISYFSFRDYIKKNNLLPVFVETGGTDVNEFDWADYKKEADDSGLMPCLIMGNESNGIPDEFLKVGIDVYNSPSKIVSISQKPPMRSLNVAVAFGIVSHSMVSSLF